MQYTKRWILTLFVILLVNALPNAVSATVIDRLVISELFYDRVGVDNRFEWVELFNGESVDIDLEGWSLGYGGTSLVSGRIALSGLIRAGQYFVVGGPQSDLSNHSPIFDLAVDLSPDLQNSGALADGVAIFNLPPEGLSETSLPHDVLVYGGVNDSQLIDVDGLVSRVHSPDVTNGQSIERLAQDLWAPTDSPNPGSGALINASLPTLVPLPNTLILMLVGLLVSYLVPGRPRQWDIRRLANTHICRGSLVKQTAARSGC